uniref:Uncharacterized protein n=1 Tax=Xiphophorus couchianus TaxID=32473 RepID=A0A3B5LEP1_9TELE
MSLLGCSVFIFPRKRPNAAQLHRQSHEGGGAQEAAGESPQPGAQPALHLAGGLRPRQVLHQPRHAALHGGLSQVLLWIEKTKRRYWPRGLQTFIRGNVILLGYWIGSDSTFGFQNKGPGLQDWWILSN